MRQARISELRDSTKVNEQTGAVLSAQTAELDLPEQALQGMWSPTHLERLARTYWRFLSRVTLGLVRVRYSDEERAVVLLARPLKLLIFSAPEYEVQADHGLVRWRLQRGLLVAKRGRGGAGHLQIEVRRLPSTRQGRARLEVGVEVENFYPRIAFGLGRWIYEATQSRIHVIVTNRFLRSLAKLKLAQSRVGSLESPPRPRPEPRTDRRRRRAAWRGRGGR
jgi:hypothetical protein